MKINSKIFNLPPYISTSWSKICALHMNGSHLIVTLASGETISIPGLSAELLEMIFNAHASYLEQEIQEPKSPPSMPSKIPNSFVQAFANSDEIDLPFKFGFTTMDGMTSVMQHNPAQANAPDLPQEILHKITAIAKILATDEGIAAPKAEPHCNCMHCQIAKAIASGMETTAESPGEDELVISDEDLKFQQWKITQVGEKMYSVTNLLDELEKYTVYLGEPIGCTCGSTGCEHILAVLKS